MPLFSGHKLGPYEILTPIGKGGMGEVYRAHDSRLNRDVAIKVSAAQFTERFEREAKAIAALNHPNICQIYDVGPNYLVLDFGLAKLSRDPEEAVGGDPSISPTLTIGMTEAGMILGTAAYMSPEQARGKNVDKRADIWAFGVVLYEMLTGRRLFAGEDVGEILAAVIKDDPRWDGVPAKVRPLLERCLEKDPKR